MFFFVSLLVSLLTIKFVIKISLPIFSYSMSYLASQFESSISTETILTCLNIIHSMTMFEIRLKENI